MSIFKRLFRWLIALVWYTFAVTVVVIAAGFGVARLMLPYASEYTADIEKQMTATLGQPVKVASLDAEFIGFTPTLVLKDVAMYNKKNTSVLLRFPKIRIGLNVLDSAIYQQVIFTRFDLAGIDLFIKRNKNGDFSIRGVEVATAHAQDSAKKDEPDELDFAVWIFTHSRITLELNNLVYVDEYRLDKTYRFNNVSVVLENDGEQHQISSVFRFPGNKEKELSVYVESWGDPLNWKNWNGKIYTQGANISPQQFFSTHRWQQYDISSAPLDFELWMDIGASRPITLQGKVRTHSLTVKRSDAAFKHEDGLIYRNIGAEFKWDRIVDGWALSVKDFSFNSALGQWPSSSFTFTWQQAQDQRTNIAAHISHFHLDELNPLVLYFREYLDKDSATLEQYKYLGVVKNLNLQTVYENKPKLYLSADLDQVAIGKKDKSFAISGVSGDVLVNGDNGVISLKSSKTKIVFPEAFDEALWLGNVDSHIVWKTGAAATRLKLDYMEVSNDIGKLSVQGEVVLEKKGPRFDLTGAVSNFNLKKIPAYLPLRYFSAGSADWLRSAFKGGVCNQGEFILKGRADDFPFNGKNGKFEINAHVQDGVLKHGKEWPVISKIHGDFDFNGRHLRFSHASGEVMNAPLRNVSVEIPDLLAEQVDLKIDGNAEGSTQSKFNYVLNSEPLNRRYGELLKDVRAIGDSNLRLQLNVGLSDHGGVDVGMDLSLHKNHFALAGRKALFSQVSGDIHVKNESVFAKNIRAVSFGQEANITIETKQAEKERLRDEFIIVTLNGYFSAPRFSENYLPVLKDLSSGVAPWTVQVNIPLVKHARNLRGDQGVEVEIDSDLQGVALNLPKPFRKTAGEKLPLHASLVMTKNNHAIYRVRLGGEIDAVVDSDLENSDKIRGEFRFGAGHAVLPNSDGLYLVGQVEEFSYDIWKSLIDQIEFDYRQNTSSENGSPLIKSVALHIAKFVFLGQNVEDLDVKAKRLEKYTQVSMDSKAIKGQLKVPRDLKNGVLKLNLDYWHLNSSDSGSSGAMDPRELPAMDAEIQNVTYDQRMFGKVSFSATKTVEGLRLERLSVNDETTAIDGFGKWAVLAGGQMSEFQFNLESSDIGASMRNLGYVDSIEGGRGSVHVDVAWPGSLPAVNFEKVHGKVAFKLVKGRLLEYDPLGGASVLGLFSIQTLPKRLLLDFSDLYKKGLEFDSISGHFDISDGDAYTSDFLMEGSVVSASLAGRIGMVAQDYDQLIKVQVHVADFISFVGLLVSSPWSVILPQLFKDEFKTTLKYSLSGSWGDPKLEPLVQDLLIPEDDDDEF